MVFVLIALVLFACAPIAGELSNCRSNLAPNSLLPEACGNCILRVSDGKLSIEKAIDCPRYQSYTCTQRGKEVIVDNLTCKPRRIKQ
ncbi:MAG: hypothetical protein NZL90_02265 [Aquificaceae bacterium]|nr:hypothetical protein [Aquificaceae bacterium]MDW8237045.1 hypothetical protein [Aquificaceae bacterium]